MKLRTFLRDQRGNFAIMTGILAVPLFGSAALAVDYSNASRMRQECYNALDAAGIATASKISGGMSDADAKKFANAFFIRNLSTLMSTTFAFDMTPPQLGSDGLRQPLVLHASMTYAPILAPVYEMWGNKTISIDCESHVQMRNTLEVALVFDNSGSMKDKGTGSSKSRMDVLKTAGKQLVATISEAGLNIKQAQDPVKFAVVPFASSVNVGVDNFSAEERKKFFDGQGISPLHHENFNWEKSFPSNTGDPATCFKCVEKLALPNTNVAAYIARGEGWNDVKAADGKTIKDRELTRQFLFESIKINKQSAVKWAGCVEARLYPYNISDASPNASLTYNLTRQAGRKSTFSFVGAPETLFVPLFAPDEPDSVRNVYNNWWSDDPALNNRNTDTDWRDTGRNRLVKVDKYLEDAPRGTTLADGKGPNQSCETAPITPLTSVSTAGGRTAINKAIDNMVASGGTNVPEGMAWGWRTLSSRAPFTQGRPETNRGNDKVLIVLTDGANTYYKPSSLGFTDPASLESIYSSYGYLKPPYATAATRNRLFGGTGISVSYNNDTYTKAMNKTFAMLCDNAKKPETRLLVITVALDLSEKNSTEKAQIESLRKCASDSRFRKDDNGVPIKLFYNPSTGNLEKTFEEIARELSNLRIVG